MHHYLVVVTFVLFAGLGACSSSSMLESSAPGENTITLKPVRAVVNNEENRIVDLVKSRIETTQRKPPLELRLAQFVDAQNGWASSDRTMYRTSDGGMNWRNLNPTVPDDSWITSFFFIDPNHGWLTLIHRNTTSSYGAGRASSILATSDGGNTWREQWTSSTHSWIQDVSFLDASKGVAVGGQVIEYKGKAAQLVFALSTNDGGRTWTDISEDLGRAIKTPYMLGNDEGNSVRWVSSSRLFILTRRGRLVVTDDSSKTWKTLVHFEEDRPSITKSGLYKMLFDSKDCIGILGGSRGDEGYWTYLITLNKPDTWQSYELVRVPLLDAVFLSEQEILAVGEEHKLNDEETSAPRLPEGIIVLSKDNGKTWSPIYRTGAEEMLISLTKINETEFYAVSDIGTFLKFRLK